MLTGSRGSAASSARWRPTCPRSRWRSVAMRRPGCTASLACAERVAEQGGGGVEVGDGEGQPEERRPGPSPPCRFLGPDQLEDHLAGPEEHLAHRARRRCRCRAPARPRGRRASSAAVVRPPSGVSSTTWSMQRRRRWGGSPARPAARRRARVGEAVEGAVGERAGRGVAQRPVEDALAAARGPTRRTRTGADPAGAVVVDREAGGPPTPRAGRRPRSRRWSASRSVRSPWPHARHGPRRAHRRTRLRAGRSVERRCGPGGGAPPCRSGRRPGTTARSRAPEAWSDRPVAASSAQSSSTAWTPPARISVSASDPGSSSSPASMLAARSGS